MNWSGRGESSRPGGCDVLPGPRSQESRRNQRSRRNPLLQAKLKVAGQACVSPQLSQSPFPQNWLALLGSHCSNRTMDGSLLAPLMNSSRDSLPEGQSGRKRISVSGLSGTFWKMDNIHSPSTSRALKILFTYAYTHLFTVCGHTCAPRKTCRSWFSLHHVNVGPGDRTQIIRFGNELCV